MSLIEISVGAPVLVLAIWLMMNEDVLWSIFNVVLCVVPFVALIFACGKIGHFILEFFK